MQEGFAMVFHQCIHQTNIITSGHGKYSICLFIEIMLLKCLNLIFNIGYISNIRKYNYVIIHTLQQFIHTNQISEEKIICVHDNVSLYTIYTLLLHAL